MLCVPSYSFLQATLHNLGLDQVGCAGLSQGYAGGNHHRIADLDCVLLTGHIHSQGEHPVGGIHLAGQVGVHAPGDGKLPPGGLILAQSHDGAGRAEAGNDFGGVARPGGRQDGRGVQIQQE